MTTMTEQNYIEELKQDIEDYQELISSGMLDGGQISQIEQCIKEVQKELSRLV